MCGKVLPAHRRNLRAIPGLFTMTRTVRQHSKTQKTKIFLPVKEVYTGGRGVRDFEEGFCETFFKKILFSKRKRDGFIKDLSGPGRCSGHVQDLVLSARTGTSPDVDTGDSPLPSAIS